MPSSLGLNISRVFFSYLDGFALRDISLTVAPGERVGILGPNGSGKTTLLRLASGVLRPSRGEIRLGELDLRRLSRREVAQRVAVVPQHLHMPFAFTVREMVMLGRTPFVKGLSGDGAADAGAVERALDLVAVGPLRDRFFNDLSGGERQKVILAMALAQEPKILLLDEPTVHLDINHQVEILEVVKGLNEREGVTVIAVLHDLNLAALYFQRLVLLKEGAVFSQGPPSQVLTEEMVREVFSASVAVGEHPWAKVPQIMLRPKG